MIDDLRLSGSCRMLFPRPTPGKTELEAVLLNTSGGVTGGDRFTTRATAGQDSHLTLTTQAAERAYRASDTIPGQITTDLSVEDNATLHWLPQETILFEGSRLQRRLRVDLAANARFLMVEPVLFGRLAMGETLRHADFNDRVDIRQNGSLLFADAVRLTGDVQSRLDRPAIAKGGRAMASLLFVAPEADAHLAPLRALLPQGSGASLIRPGLLFARLLAEDGHALRQSLIPALDLLRATPLPRTWML